MHGYNCNKLMRLRTALQLKANGGFEPLDRLAEADVDGFLIHQRRLILLTAIEEAKGATSDSALNASNRSLEADWAKDRQQLQQYLSGMNVTVNHISNTSAYLNTSTITPGGGREPVPETTVWKPSERELQLRQGVVEWAKQKRTESMARGLPELMMRSYPDSVGLWQLLYEQSQADQPLTASRLHLEKQMREVVLKTSQGQLVGGEPSLLGACLVYLKMKGQANNQYSLIWLLLRCGLSAEAAQVAKAQLNDVLLSEAILGRGGWSSSYHETGGGPDFRGAIDVVLNAGASEGQAKATHVYNTSEDWLWLRLSQLGPRPAKTELETLQRTIRKYQTAFKSRPLLLLLLQALVLDYAAAVPRLLAEETPGSLAYVEALHVGLVQQLSVHNITSIYLASTRASGTILADYGLLGGADLVAQLLLLPQAPLLPLLDQALPSPSARQLVLEQGAQGLARSGRHWEAAALWEAGGHPQEALDQLLVLLSRSLARSASANSRVDQALVQRVREALGRMGGTVARHPVALALAMGELLLAVSNGDYRQAMGLVEERLTNLVPLKSEAIQQCVDEAEALPPPLALLLPHLYLAVCSVLARLHATGGASLRSRAQLLVSAAGMLRMPSDVFAKLISLSSGMVN
jgi:hypothetical protein